jgi:hypothetical protein
MSCGAPVWRRAGYSRPAATRGNQESAPREITARSAERGLAGFADNSKKSAALVAAGMSASL